MSSQPGPERIAQMLALLRQWQALERASLNDTAEVMERTDDPMVRMIMAIIRHDSLMHHQVQQLLIDSLTRRDVEISGEGLREMRTRLEAHDRLEKETLELARKLQAEAWTPVQKQLLEYLMIDESKHEKLLASLAEIERELSDD